MRQPQGQSGTNYATGTESFPLVGKVLTNRQPARGARAHALPYALSCTATHWA
jgi:hypothetical protein